MNDAIYKKVTTKAHCGPGGIKCPCCSSGRNTKKAKQTHNRILRRTLKMVKVTVENE